MTTNPQSETPGFYEIDNKLYFVKENGDMYELDFDISRNLRKEIHQKDFEENLQKNEEHAIKNKNKEVVDMSITDKEIEKQTEDALGESKESKPNGSVAAMEKRISDCMEKTGKSREECSKEVKAKMKSEGSENTNTSDTVTICPKELANLREKAGKYDMLEKEHATLQETHKSFTEDFKTWKSKVDVILKERETELEQQRQNKVKQLSHDFDLREDKIKGKTMDRLLEDEELLNDALKRNKSADFATEDKFEETKDMGNSLHDRYFMKV